MGDILEQEELDALIGEGAEGLITDSTDDIRGGGEKYDFASQEYAVSRLIPALSQVQSSLAEGIKQQMRQWVPSVDNIRADRIAVMKFAEVMRSTAAPAYIVSMRAEPLGSPIYLAFEAELVFTLVDHFYGGRGRSQHVRAQDFSPSESRFMERLTESLIPAITAAWHTAVDINPVIDEHYHDFRFVDELQQSDTLMVTRFTVQIGTHEAELMSVVPWAAIDPIRDNLGGVVRTSRQEHDEQWRTRLMSGLVESQLSLVAKLGDSKVSLKRVCNLQVGDILPIDNPSQVTIQLEGQPLMTASFGTHHGQLSAKIKHIHPAIRRRD
ncbi:MAG: FliM/FliN family flagellar motor switch protein [Paraperlucidibaca sp.]|nr:FliM/FliN family flagellar motor switch protein [Paraperlucidibaca sp.]